MKKANDGFFFQTLITAHGRLLGTYPCSGLEGQQCTLKAKVTDLIPASYSGGFGFKCNPLQFFH